MFNYITASSVHLFNKRFRFLILFIVLCYPQISISQSEKKLTLQEAIEAGIANSKTLRSDSAKILVASAKYAEQKNLQIPSMLLFAGYTRISDNITPFTVQFPGQSEPFNLTPQVLNNYTTRASLSENLFNGLKTRSGIESAHYLEMALKSDFEKDKPEIIINTIQAYYQLYKLNLTKEQIEDNIKRTDEQLQQVGSFEKNGIATKNDVLRVQLQQSNMELSKIDLENTLAVTTFNFCLMLGLPTNTRITIDSTSLHSAMDLGPLDSYMQPAGNMRAEIKSANYRLMSAEKNISFVKSNYFPQLNAGANFYYNRPNARVFPATDKWKDTWDAGINLSMNISNLYTNKKQIAEARASYLQYELQKEELSEAIQMEVNQQYSNFLQGQKKIEVARKTVMQATENYRTNEVKYKNNISLLTDLLDASSLLLQSQINLSIVIADTEVAYYRLLKSAGTLTIK